eukprot:s3375_g3.t1
MFQSKDAERWISAAESVRLNADRDFFDEGSTEQGSVHAEGGDEEHHGDDDELVNPQDVLLHRDCGDSDGEGSGGDGADAAAARASILLQVVWSSIDSPQPWKGRRPTMGPQNLGGPGDHRPPPLTTVVDSWIPWDEPLTEELSIHWMVPDFTAYQTLCQHIADDAIDLRPDGVDPRDAEQIHLYLHHLPLTDFVYIFSELHREVRQLRDQRRQDRAQLDILVEWAAASDGSLAGPLGLLLRPDDL